MCAQLDMSEAVDEYVCVCVLWASDPVSVCLCVCQENEQMDKWIHSWTLIRERSGWSMGDEMSEDFADEPHT